MWVYQFRIWDKNFAVDVESGNFFEVDAAASKAINLLSQHSEQESIQRLGKKYGLNLAAKVIRNLCNLKKRGMLFSTKQEKGHGIKRKITDLTLNITNKCNLRCRYCWNRWGSYGHGTDNKQKMDYQTSINAVDLLIRESTGAKDLVIDFYGGEPLLNFGLIKKTIEYCKKTKERKKINFRFLLATNATLLSKEKAEFLIQNGVDIAVSLDGNRNTQDIQRPFPDGRGSFKVIMDNINSLNEDFRKRIVGRATFTPYSTKIVETFNFLRRLGFERIEVCESEKAGYGLEGRNRFFFSGEKGVNQLKALYYKLAQFYTQEIIKGNLNYENTYFNRFFKQLSRLYHIQSIVGTCSAGYSLMAVDIDGSVYPCTAFVGIPQFRIGSVKTKIDENKLKFFLATKIYINDSCNECWAKMICRGCGSCYNLNYFTNKNIGQPDSYYCELFRHKTKLMIAMICKISEDAPQSLNKLFTPEYYITRGRRKKNAS